jgi:hypothetical protein
VNTVSFFWGRSGIECLLFEQILKESQLRQEKLHAFPMRAVAFRRRHASPSPTYT